MKVACSPCSRAASLTTSRQLITLSAMVSASASRRSISCWLGAISWWDCITEMPIRSSMAIATCRKSCDRSSAVWSKNEPESSGCTLPESGNRKNSISGCTYTVKPPLAAPSRLRRSTQRGSPSKGSPSVVSTSQNILATPPESGWPGRTWKVLGLGRRDGERLEEPQHVREPQPDKADVALLHHPQDVLALLVHVPSGSRSGSEGHATCVVTSSETSVSVWTPLLL